MANCWWPSERWIVIEFDEMFIIIFVQTNQQQKQHGEWSDYQD